MLYVEKVLGIDYPLQVDAIVLFSVEVVFLVLRWRVDLYVATFNRPYYLRKLVLFFKGVHCFLHFRHQCKEIE